MKAADGLVQWMTHRGFGGWESFKRVVAEVFADDDEPPKPYHLADTLSMMGIVDFFVGGRPRWSVFAPVIAGTAPGEGVLAGGRTPELMRRLQGPSNREQVDITEEPLSWGFTKVHLFALDDEDLASVARKTGIPFIERAAERLVRRAPTVSTRVAQGRVRQAPRSWDVESFDFSALRYVPREIAGSAKRFSPPKGVPMYAVERPDGTLVEMERRASVYAAAQLKPIALLDYDADRATLSTPLRAPLPADLERAAAMCTGDMPSSEGGRIVFRGVRWSVGSLLLGLTGCPLPVTPILREESRR